MMMNHVVSCDLKVLIQGPLVTLSMFGAQGRLCVSRTNRAEWTAFLRRECGVAGLRLEDEDLEGNDE